MQILTEIKLKCQRDNHSTMKKYNINSLSSKILGQICTLYTFCNHKVSRKRKKISFINLTLPRIRTPDLQNLHLSKKSGALTIRPQCSHLKYLNKIKQILGYCDNIFPKTAQNCPKIYFAWMYPIFKHVATLFEPKIISE